MTSLLTASPPDKGFCAAARSATIHHVCAAQLDGSFLERSTLFLGLDRAVLDGLARLSRFVDLDAGKTLFQQGDKSAACPQRGASCAPTRWSVRNDSVVWT